MKVTYNWLKQYVDFHWTVDELTERLTMLGLEVEGVQKISGEFEGVVVAQVLSSDRHPNADKLSVCRVADGQGERQIVCGAKNFKVGDKVPLALPGTTLPTPPGQPPFTIKVGKIRGVESHGMMCSAKELGLTEDAEGLLILPSDAKVGQPLAEHLGRAAGDIVYDLETTPNRPDWNSVIGIAREISALTGNPLKVPRVDIPETAAATESAGSWVQVRLDDAELCPRYTARIVRGAKVGPSPAWLRQTLEKVGLRSINNVVDVTNFVMLEVGQPLHAFDYHLLSKAASGDGAPAIVVRRAADGEKFTTLDGQERTLTDSALLIADETKGIALAGIMGGQNSEINDQTKDVLIESAYFKPQNIRATSKKLGLRTDASYRFERGADIEVCDWASRRAAQLIIETAGGQLLQGVVDAYPQRFEAKQITLRHAKVTQLLGVEIPAAQNVQYLRQLGLEVVSEQGTESCTVRIPSFRVDLKREVDIIEEVTRLYGVDKIPSQAPRGAVGSNPFDAIYDQLMEARRILTGLGLFEAQGQTLIAEGAAKLAVSDAAQIARLENPLSSDMDVLRPSLIPGLLDSLRHNANHKNESVALFEVGRVFVRSNGATREERRIAIAITGDRNPLFWKSQEREQKSDIYDLKGLLEEFLDVYGARGVTYSRRSESTPLLLESATIQLPKQPLGELGQLLPPLAKHYDLRYPVFVAELNLDLLLARRATGKSFKVLPAFPTIRRDIAMLVPEATTHEMILQAIKQAKPQNLEAIELFDVFRGRNVPEGQKSMAYALTYRHAERTLTDAEVNAAHEKVVAHLRQTLQAVIRE